MLSFLLTHRKHGHLECIELGDVDERVDATVDEHQYYRGLEEATAERPNEPGIVHGNVHLMRGPAYTIARSDEGKRLDHVLSRLLAVSLSLTLQRIGRSRLSFYLAANCPIIHTILNQQTVQVGLWHGF